MSEYIFPKRLKEARQNKGLNMAELAEKTGITASAISSYERAEENGKTKPKIPSIENAMKLAIALGVSIDWLCGIDSISENSNYSEMQIAEKCLSAVETLLQICFESEINPHHKQIAGEIINCTQIILYNEQFFHFAEELKAAYLLTNNSALSEEVKKALLVAVKKKYVKELSKYVADGRIQNQIVDDEDFPF